MNLTNAEIKSDAETVAKRARDRGESKGEALEGVDMCFDTDSDRVRQTARSYAVAWIDANWY